VVAEINNNKNQKISYEKFNYKHFSKHIFNSDRNIYSKYYNLYLGQPCYYSNIIIIKNRDMIKKFIKEMYENQALFELVGGVLFLITLFSLFYFAIWIGCPC
jgi:hypothetical protein